MDRIDKFVYINLDSRPDRNTHIQNELKRFGIPKEKIIRITAVEDVRGARGCSLSQAKMAEAFRDSGDKVWCFLEDDHYFTHTREETDEIVNKFLDDERFDVLLGCYCNVKGFDWKGTPFRRTSQSSMCSFYIAKRKVCEGLIASHSESARSMDPKFGKKAGIPCDFMWEHLMKVFVFVAPYKPYGSQIINYSNIRNKIMNYSNYVGMKVTNKL